MNLKIIELLLRAARAFTYMPSTGLTIPIPVEISEKCGAMGQKWRGSDLLVNPANISARRLNPKKQCGM